MPEVIPVVGMLVAGQPIKNGGPSANSRLSVLEDEFRGMFSDKIQRSKFLAQVIKDWYDAYQRRIIINNTLLIMKEKYILQNHNFFNKLLNERMS